MHKKMRWGKLIFLCAVVLVVFFVGQSKIRQRIEALDREETSLRIELSNLREDAGELQRQLDMIGTDVYVMSVAREEYDFLRPGELCFEFNNPEALSAYTPEERQRLEYELSID